MSTQSERFEQIVRALAEEGEALDPTLDDTAKLRWYRAQAVAALELPRWMNHEGLMGRTDPLDLLDLVAKRGEISTIDVAKILCCLQAEVSDRYGIKTACDCFCGQSGFWGSKNYGGKYELGYRNDLEAIRMIILAARKSYPPQLSDDQGLLSTLKIDPSTVWVDLAEVELAVDRTELTGEQCGGCGEQVSRMVLSNRTIIRACGCGHKYYTTKAEVRHD